MIQGMIFYTSKDGKQQFEKNYFTRERFDLVDNPLFESLFRANRFDDPKVMKRVKYLGATHLRRILRLIDSWRTTK